MIDGFEPTEDFKEMALDFFGCDGGDTTTERGIWFCGIEWGMGFKEEEDLRTFYKKWPISFGGKDLDKVNSYPYGKTQLKMYSVIKSGLKLDIDSSSDKYYLNICKNEKCMLYGSGDLKLNLYPFSFTEDKDNMWTEWVYKKTGFYSKMIYKTWCQQYRFPKFKQLVKDLKPKVIICTGVTHIDSYIGAFCGFEDIFNLKRILLNNVVHIDTADASTKKQFYYLNVTDTQTLLVVVPFFGWRKNNLRKDDEIESIGQWIRSKI